MAKDNKNITFKGQPTEILGAALEEGSFLPSFTLAAKDLSPVTNSVVENKVCIISCIPSVDTPVCATQVKTFYSKAKDLGDDLALLTASVDLPFALGRFCGAEGIENAITASDYKTREFGKSFGVLLQDLMIFTRAVFVADKQGKLVHVEYVDEITDQPDYEAALDTAKSLL